MPSQPLSGRKLTLALTAIAVVVVIAVGTAIGVTRRNNNNNDGSSTASASRTGLGADDANNATPQPTSSVPSTSPSISFAPSISMAPSGSPSVSLRPSQSPTVSQQPSETPSSTPTAFPSALPTTQPSLQPSISMQPSDSPSVTPSTIPTQSPSTLPSRLPSVAPSSVPTQAPTTATPTAQPTRTPTTPVSTTSSFRLQLHWKREFFWQETYDSFSVCMECTDCNRLSRDQQIGDCSSRDNGNCGDGDQFWLRDCDGTDSAKFNLLQYADYDMLRLHRSDDPPLCVTRATAVFVNLQPCNRLNAKQHWNKIEITEPFAIRLPDTKGDDGRCLTQQHHPTKDELFFMQDCRIPRKHDTLYWEAI